MSNNADDNSKSSGSTGPSEKQILVQRLREADVSQQRFIRLKSGAKSPHNHIQHEPDDIGNHYGVYPGDGLLFLDLDMYESSSLPNWIQNLPLTFTIRSPHGGEHRYYTVEEKVNKNSKFDWGSIRAVNQYVVGPGSELDSCNKTGHDCSQQGQGQYTILHDKPIALVSATDLTLNKSKTQDQPSAGYLANDVTDITSLEEIDAPFDVEKRLEVLQESDVGDTVQHLIRGEYGEGESSGDRSRAETRLCTYLKFAMDNDKQIVKQVMDWICSKYPMTACGKQRKWLESPSHRASALSSKYDPDDTYTPPGSPVGPRPEVGSDAYTSVFDALLLEELATTQDLVNHEFVHVGPRQVQKTLNLLEDHGLVTWERKGRSVIYRPRETDKFLP